MSILTYWSEADLEAGVEWSAAVAYEVFITNVEAALDLIYGPSRRIDAACPAHDHDEDGGEPHSLPILQRSFGYYTQNISVVGIPLGYPSSGSFAKSTPSRTAQTDYSNAKRLDCVGIVLPGGVSSVRVSVTEYHEVSGKAVILYVALRSLSSVNFKLGVAREEVRGEISYTTSGAAARRNQTITMSSLSRLGDPTRDREVEASLWLGSDLDTTTDHRLLAWEIVGIDYTSAAREADPQDPPLSAILVREVQSEVGLVSPQLAAKIKNRSNALNIGLWGSTPGLLDGGAPDRRRTYQEEITGVHQHQGRFMPQADLSIVGDGACLKDTQSFGYLTYLGETLPLVANTPPAMDHRPNQGAFLHFTDDLSQGWVQYNIRRSIPAGCGALLLRVACHPGYQGAGASYDSSQTLLVSVSIVPVGGGSSIVSSLRCGPHQDPLDSSDADYGFVELLPRDDVAYQRNRALESAGKKGWNKNAEVPDVRKDALQLNSVTYRISEEIRINLTYPPERPSETYHPTGDYDVRLRFKMRNSAGLCDDEAGCLWVCLWSAPGY